MSQPEKKPAAAGSFSPVRVIVIGSTKLLFISGLTSGDEAPFDIRRQSEVIFRRMQELLSKEGGNLSHLVKITAFLTDIRDYNGYNEVRNRIFSEFSIPPASASVGITYLVRPEARIEIEGVAVIQS